MSNKTAFTTDHPAFAELKKAQEIIFEAVDQTARKNLEATEKLLEINKQRFANVQDFSNPGDYVAKQSAAFKEYAEQVSAHLEALASIGASSREKLSEVGTDFGKAFDFSDFFPFADAGKTKTTKSSAKSS